MHSINPMISSELSTMLPSSLWHQTESGTFPESVLFLSFSACSLCFLAPLETSVGSTLLMTVPGVVQASLEITIESRMTCDLPASSSQVQGLQDYMPDLRVLS